nr:G protein-coupled receptor [Proales similis]
MAWISVLLTLYMVYQAKSRSSLNYYEEDGGKLKIFFFIDDLTYVNGSMIKYRYDWDYEYHDYVMQSVSLLYIMCETNTNLILNNQLKLNDFKFEDFAPVIYLYNFQGIDALFSIEGSFGNNTQQLIDIDYKFGKLIMKLDNRPFDKCELNQTARNEITKSKLVMNFSFNHNVKFFKGTCSALFANSRIDFLVLGEIVDSLVFHNLLSFRNLTYNGRLVELNASVASMNINRLYGVDLNFDLLLPQIFKDSVFQYITIDGSLKTIEPGVLAQMRIKILYMKILNLKYFVRSNPAWLDNYGQHPFNSTVIIYESSVVRDGFTAGTFSFLIPYQKFDFENESFCLFKRYPVKQDNLKLFVVSSRPIQITCPLLWLLQGTIDSKKTMLEYYKAHFNRSLAFIPNALSQMNVTRAIEECDFEALLDKCAPKEASKPVPFYADGGYEVLFTVQMLKFVLSVVLQPTFCLLGFVLNLLIVFVVRRIIFSSDHSQIKSAQLRARKIKLFQYMQLNAVTNCGYCLCMSTSVLNECIKFNGIFCSPFIVDQPFQFFSLFVHIYLANTMKCCSALSQVLITLYRLLMNKEENNSKFKTLFLKLNPVKVFILVLLISAVTSGVTFLHNDNYSYSDLVQNRGFLLFNIIRLPNAFSHYGSTVPFYIFYILFTDVFAVLLSLVIDLLLMRGLKQHSSKVASKVGSSNAKDKSHKNLNRMIIANALIIVLFKIPKLVSSIQISIYYLTYQDNYLFKFSYQTSNCYIHYAPFDSLCPNYQSIAESIHIFAYSFYFFVYLFFNSEFYKAAISIFIEKRILET